MPYIETVPQTGDEEDYEKMRQDYDSKFSQRNIHDPRVSWVGAIFQGVVIILVAGLVYGIIGMKADIIVLLNRPVAVSQKDYDDDMRRRSEDASRRSQDIQQIQNQISELRVEVEKLRDEKALRR